MLTGPLRSFDGPLRDLRLGAVLDVVDGATQAVAGLTTFSWSEPAEVVTFADQPGVIGVVPSGPSITLTSTAPAFDPILRGGSHGYVVNPAGGIWSNGQVAFASFDGQLNNYVPPPSLPITLSPGDIVLAAVTRDAADELRHGTIVEYGALVVMPEAPAPGAMAPTVFSWPGRSGVVAPVVDLDARFAALPTLDATGVDFGDIEDVAFFLEKFDPSYAAYNTPTGAGAKSSDPLTPYLSTDPRRSNYSRYRRGPYVQAALHILCRNGAEATRRRLFQRLVERGQQWGEVFQQTGDYLDTDGANRQHHVVPVAFWLWATGQQALAATLLNTGGMAGNLDQFIEMTPALAASLVPHDDPTKPYPYRRRTLPDQTGVAPGKVRIPIDTSSNVQGDPQWFTPGSLILVNETTGARCLTSDSPGFSYLPSGVIERDLNIEPIDGQPLPTFAQGDVIYMTAREKLIVGRPDWRIDVNPALPDTDLQIQLHNFAPTWRAQYRPLNIWGGPAIICAALGITSRQIDLMQRYAAMSLTDYPRGSSYTASVDAFDQFPDGVGTGINTEHQALIANLGLLGSAPAPFAPADFTVTLEANNVSATITITGQPDAAADEISVSINGGAKFQLLAIQDGLTGSVTVELEGFGPQEVALYRENAFGSSAATLASIDNSVGGTAPTAAGALADQTYNIGSGPQTVDAATDFTNATGGTWSVAGAGATIDQTGLVTITTETVRAGDPVVVTYTNGAGAASSGFSVTVQAAAPTALTIDEVSQDRLSYPPATPGGAGLATIPVSGTATPGAVVEVLDYRTKAPTAWIEVATADQTGAWYGTVAAIAQPGGYFARQVRLRDNTAVTATTTTVVGVGPVIVLEGQSIEAHMFSAANNELTPAIVPTGDRVLLMHEELGTIALDPQNGLTSAAANLANTLMALGDPDYCYTFVALTISGSSIRDLIDDQRPKRDWSANAQPIFDAIYNSGSHVALYQEKHYNGDNGASFQFYPIHFCATPDGDPISALGVGIAGDGTETDRGDGSYNLDRCLFDLAAPANQFGRGVFRKDQTKFLYHLQCEDKDNGTILGQMVNDQGGPEAELRNVQRKFGRLRERLGGGTGPGLPAFAAIDGRARFMTLVKKGRADDNDPVHLADDEYAGLAQQAEQLVAYALDTLGEIALPAPAVISSVAWAPDGAQAVVTMSQDVTTNEPVPGPVLGFEIARAGQDQSDESTAWRLPTAGAAPATHAATVTLGPGSNQITITPVQPFGNGDAIRFGFGGAMALDDPATQGPADFWRRYPVTPTPLLSTGVPAEPQGAGVFVADLTAGAVPDQVVLAGDQSLREGVAISSYSGGVLSDLTFEARLAISAANSQARLITIDGNNLTFEALPGTQALRISLKDNSGASWTGGTITGGTITTGAVHTITLSLHADDVPGQSFIRVWIDRDINPAPVIDFTGDPVVVDGQGDPIPAGIPHDGRFFGLFGNAAGSFTTADLFERARIWLESDPAGDVSGFEAPHVEFAADLGAAPAYGMGQDDAGSTRTAIAPVNLGAGGTAWTTNGGPAVPAG